MKNNIILLYTIILIVIFGCANQQENKTDPLKELSAVDNLLSALAEKPQKIETSSNKKSTIKGEKGTVIYVDPDKLEVEDGSPLGDKIKVELLEMTDKSSLIFNNAPTISNGRPLVTGGAYYINMTSNGKQLKVKAGKGLNVEFPKLTEDKMSLFLGKRDSLGQINWAQGERNFERKKLKKPQASQKVQKKSFSQVEAIFSYVASQHVSANLSEEERKEIEKAYQKAQREYEEASKTYKAIELIEFGWINCDRFLRDTTSLTDIQLIVKNGSFVSSIRAFGVFKEIKSIMPANYWHGQLDTLTFRNIPIGKELQIIALSVKGETPFIFEKSIKIKSNQKVEIEFTATTQVEIKKKIEIMN